MTTSRPSPSATDSIPPESHEERLSRARSLLGTPQEEEGVRELEALERELKAVLEKQPDDAHAHHLLGSVYFFGGDDAEAGPELARALELAPERADYHYLQGAWFMEQEQIPEAAQAFAQAAALDPSLGHAWTMLGDAFLRLGEPTQAKVALARGLAVEPRTPADRAQTGQLLWELGEQEFALAAFEDAAARDPEDFFAHCNAGQLLQLMGDPERSLAYFQVAHTQSPDDWRVRAKLVQLHQALGQIEERDAQLTALRQLRAEGKVDSEAFVREQFEEADQPVVVYEHFELEGERPVRYRFELLDEDGDLSDHRISLGSYPRTDQIAKELGASGGRQFHLDRYGPDGAHESLGSFAGEPTYEQVRERVVKRLVEEAERKPEE